MILIDALYINNGGGKVLLDYLIENLERSNLEVFYLLDLRVKNNIPAVSNSNKIIFMHATLFGRYMFYKKNKTAFTKVFCFGNLPPYIKLPTTTYTYFHQPIYLKIPQTLRLLDRFIFMMKILILKKISKNTNFWLVQSNFIKQKIEQKYEGRSDKILIIPFYPPLSASQLSFDRKKDQYVYVSNAPPHKNHLRLIEAFSIFYDQNKRGRLLLTVSDDFPELIKVIQYKQSLGYPIVNLGFVPRNNLLQIYCESEYLIYPSLTESFGLGLVEAIENGCKVIGANLPYTYAVCEPSIIFDPLDEKSIYDALVLSLKEDTKPSIAKVSNKINELIDLLN